jgi:hypothetical protein
MYLSGSIERGSTLTLHFREMSVCIGACVKQHTHASINRVSLVNEKTRFIVVETNP